tara:strand:+ start:405 stop:584 length:180 start_codon:yes stop_codon:yes gene_type:complete
LKSDNIKLEKFYWSERYGEHCIVKAYADFMVYLIFNDKDKNGWYHCLELKELNGENVKK